MEKQDTRAKKEKQEARAKKQESAAADERWTTISLRPAILRGRLQSREGSRTPAGQVAKASGSYTERTTISLRLGAFARRKKEELAQSRKVGKAQSREAPAILRDRPQSAAAESHTERTTISWRLCAFARTKKIRLPTVGRLRWTGCQGDKNS